MRNTLWSLNVIALIAVLGMAASDRCLAQAPETPAKEVVKASAPASTLTSSTSVDVPVFTNYRGVQIGMSAEDVRNKLGSLKEKGKVQDFFVFSDQESAQVFYDKDGMVSAISIDYVGSANNAPSPKDVLGEDIQAKADGSMYDLRRYPDAGYWVAYNRTAGDDLIVTVTMQKMD